MMQPSMIVNRPARPPRRRRWLALVLVLVLALPALWYLASPLFVNRTVEATLAEQLAPLQAGEPLTVLGEGMFERSGVRFYDGEGTARIVETADGRRLLTFEGFRVSNGPGLYVYLSGTPFPTSGAALREVAAYEVAPLQGNLGDQVYELPADLDLSQFQSVVIYCVPFSAVFSIATLEMTS